ncbi:MAG TPA: Na+/H+ antiporter NhaC family protein [Planctomycetota bacterium]|nr:Na+/H+ antiporter NhaC family protein [Planctomycetota bacterium]
MTRALPLAAFVALVLALWLLPAADPARLAAMKAPELLDASVEGTARTLGERVLEGSQVTRTEPGKAVLRLGGVRVAAPAAPSDDLGVHGLARRWLVSKLRQLSAARGDSLLVEGELTPLPGGAGFLVELRGDRLSLRYDAPGAESLAVEIEGWQPPARTSLLPPIVAILLAILFRRPVVALFCGVWTATFLLERAAGHGPLSSLARGVPAVVTDFVWPRVVDPNNQQIIGFVVAMLAMVGVMTRAGGMRGLMDRLARLASSARRTQIATWLMGLVVFFDDYANCILVGATMRPLSDRFRVAREKLAYLVDSTAAPVAGLSIFSTWIAFEVSTFSAQLPAAGMLASEGYAVFVETLPFRFYCIFTLVLAGWIAWSGRDFGPMLAAERRARRTGQLVREGGKPMVSEAATSLEPAAGVRPRSHRALLPVAVFVLITLEEIARVGWAAMKAADPALAPGDLLTLRGITELLREGNSTRALLVGSSSGLGLAVLLALAAGLRWEILRAAWTTLRSMGIAIAILYLAWSIGKACEALGTAPYLSELIGDRIWPAALPTILFLLAAVVAFSTGSSWSTMSILLPLVVGLAYNLGQDSAAAAVAAGGTAAFDGHLLMVMSIGAVLEGSIFGDHCSPISDTTVLSSTATASDHIDHVRTQIPYAVLAMGAALLVGYLPCALLGHAPWLSIVLGVAVLVLFVRFAGRRSDGPDPAAPPGAPVVAESAASGSGTGERTG